MFEEGQWVKTKRGEVGFVIGNDNRGVRLFYVKQGKPGNEIYRNLTCYEDVLPEAKEDAREVFVDLALQTKDEEWFEEVTAE